jgi:hypothetical protein
MVNYFRAFRRFERFLFKGVPEHPEPSWERNTSANVIYRHTGKSHILDRPNSHQKGEAKLIAKIIVRPDLKQVEIIREDEKPKDASTVIASS